MKIKTALLKEAVIESILGGDDLELDIDEIVDSKATSLIYDIQDIITDIDNNDFDIVDKVVSLLKSHHIDCGDCHKFG